MAQRHSDEQTERINARVSKAGFATIQRLCKEDETSVSEMMRAAMEQYLRNRYGVTVQL